MTTSLFTLRIQDRGAVKKYRSIDIYALKNQDLNDGDEMVLFHPPSSSFFFSSGTVTSRGGRGGGGGGGGGCA